jgi:hypothetical protein
MNERLVKNEGRLSCRVTIAWTSTGNAFLKMYNVSALLDHLDGQLFVYEMICRQLPTLPNVSYATASFALSKVQRLSNFVNGNN